MKANNMSLFFMRLKAPFAAFRYFQAGVYRSTMPTLPHSAAWGLINNILGIEIRTNTNHLTTQISKDIPSLNLAIGNISLAETNSLYQQLHVIPVGSSGKENLERTKGSKYFIRPVRREILTNLDVLIGIQSDDPELKQKITSGLNGEWNDTRYGLPFAGDNNLLFDSIDIFEESSIPAFWHCKVGDNDQIETETARLTVGIDRLDNSNTVSPLFAISKEKSLQPPPNAWVWTPKEP
ncbi:CRISPR-associated protein Cas5 [Leptospira alstonii]|uniref:CRISPR-associated protein Cas5 n=1 Tax=Leptospira alstonii TaxID=28452 RepID=UPI000A4C80CA|nr:CRISPR-associated protein Cas5 [Leptospira alstonii]